MTFAFYPVNNSGSQWSLNVTAFIGNDVAIHLPGLCEEAEKKCSKRERSERLDKGFSYLTELILCLIFIKQLMISRNNRGEEQEKVGVPQKGHSPCLFFPKGPEWT